METPVIENKKIIKFGVDQLKVNTPKVVNFLSELTEDVCKGLAVLSVVMNSQFWTITLLILSVVASKAKKFFGEQIVINDI